MYAINSVMNIIEYRYNFEKESVNSEILTGASLFSCYYTGWAIKIGRLYSVFNI